jgi:excisionase family DNA binding protein
MNALVPIRTAAAALGVSISTLRRWEAKGRLRPARTDGGQRCYDLAALHELSQHGAAAQRKTVAYARFSSPGQKQDLERQILIEGMRQTVMDASCS